MQTRVIPAKAGIQPRGLDAASQVEGPAEATWRSKYSEPRGVLDARVREHDTNSSWGLCPAFNLFPAGQSGEEVLDKLIEF